MSIWAIGDIHGCFKALSTLIDIINPQKGDRLIFLGDYVDRGPASCQVIELLIELKARCDIVFLMGNHELFMLSARENNDRLSEWLYFGGKETLLSYGIESLETWEPQIPTHHWQFLTNLKSYHQIDQYIFVHAGITPGKPLEEQSRHELFWKKYLTPEAYNETHQVICGHTSRKNGEIANFGHTVCLDTYAYGGQWLTGLEVFSGSYIQTNEDGKHKIGKLK